METKKVRDLVIPLDAYPHMLKTGTLREAIDKLNVAYQTGRHTVLVYDTKGKILSLLQEKDLLKGLEPRFSQRIEGGVPMAWDDMLASKAGWVERLARPVHEFMADAAIEVDVENGVLRMLGADRENMSRSMPVIAGNDSILKVVHVMVREGVSLLPVIDGEEIIGLIRMGDVFKELSTYVTNL